METQNQNQSMEQASNQLSKKQSNPSALQQTNQLTPICLAESGLRLQTTFPSLPIGFYQILNERIVANGITNERLIKAVNHVIDTCHYPTPTVADIIDFDRKDQERINKSKYDL